MRVSGNSAEPHFVLDVYVTMRGIGLHSYVACFFQATGCDEVCLKTEVKREGSRFRDIDGGTFRRRLPFGVKEERLHAGRGFDETRGNCTIHVADYCCPESLHSYQLDLVCIQPQSLSQKSSQASPEVNAFR